MKKLRIILFIFLFVSIFINGVDFKAYVATGHDDMREIIFEDQNVVLLVSKSPSEINEAFNNLKRKTFGWSTYYFNINSKASYIGDTIFSRSNRTSETMSVSYKLREEDYKSTSIKINGSVDAKVTAQTEKKSISGSVNPSFGIVRNNSKTYTKEEISEFKINIAPYSSVSLRIVGDCYVTSGVSKFFLFGIQLRKGQWERVDVETVFYELYEEKVS